MVQENIQIIIENVKKKKECLQAILQVVLVQKDIEFIDEQDISEFGLCVQKKDDLLLELNILIDEFEKYTNDISAKMPEYSKEHKKELDSLRKINNELMVISNQIQKMEYLCKVGMEEYLSQERERIKKFRVTNQMASYYYKSMNGKQVTESFFLDSKK